MGNALDSSIYVSGADSVDIASFTEVTVYKVNKDGAASNAEAVSILGPQILHLLL